MKTTKRTYTIHCMQQPSNNQLLNITSLLGVDDINSYENMLIIHYDIKFIDRQSIIKHLIKEKIRFKNSIVHKIANAIEIFSEKNIIKNRGLMAYFIFK